ncbi:MAG: LacI family DNA-binding transcriptional regulator [Armatimonadetes bacterium]|nr:LacI family DNA-binding transcriptional regulator [Armatimonadota bacterium]
MKGFSKVMAERITIEDVAKRAGVSKVTVSYVLNGRGESARISETTRERVLEAARDLQYRPNALARMLLRQRTDSIAVAFQFADYFSSASTFISEVMRGVCGACVDLGLDVLLHTRPATPGEAEADLLTDGRVDGLLVLRDEGDPTLNEILDRGFPTVLFFSRSNRPDVPYVDADNYSGGKLGTRHLIELGHTRIGMVRGPAHSVSSNDRYNGYRDALEAAGMDVRIDHVATMESPMSHPGDLLAMMSAEERPTALFVWSDDVAFSVLRWLGEIGLSVPKDVSVIGYDSSDACERVHPALTSVRQPIHDMAQEATEMLARIVRKQPVKRHQVLYPPTLDTRASTAPGPGLA